MAIDGQIDVVADGLACALDQSDDIAHLFGTHGPVIAIQLALVGVVDVELDRTVTFGDDLQSLFGIGLGLVGLAGVAIGVEPN